MDTFATIPSERVVTAAMHYPKPKIQPVQQLPMSLTASDGTGLKLVALSAKAVVQGPLAFTELHMTFHNPENRTREGRFSITLPPGAAISRLAMKLPHGWQEAEMVERQKARQVYEDYLHRRQDPALMEKKAGNQFRARIFPIPANGDKEIIISYSQKLTREDQAYRLYLKGLPKMSSLKITALVSEQQQTAADRASSLGGTTVSQKVVKVSKQGFAPDRDFEVQAGSTIAGLRNGNLALMRIRPKISTQRAPMTSVLILFDTSASRAAGFFAQVEQLGAILHHLRSEYGDDKIRLHVACFDQGVDTVFDGPIGQLGQQDLDKILARRPLGASNLEAALAWAGQTKGYRRVILFTDAIATAGNTDGSALHQAVKGLASQVHRLDVVMSGGIRDESMARKLVTGALEQDGVILDGEQGAGELARRLSRTTVSGISVSVPGARWIWPSRIDGAQPGDQYLVFADLPEGALAEGKPMTVALGGPLSDKHTAPLATVKRPLLERAWVEARIDHMDHQMAAGNLDPDMAAAVRKQILSLSTKHRVLSDYTALLVLESESDYARYDIERKALADILVVGASGIEVLQRKQPIYRVPLQAVPIPRPSVDEDDNGGPRRIGRRAPPSRDRPARSFRKRTTFDMDTGEEAGSAARSKSSAPSRTGSFSDDVLESALPRPSARPPRAQPSARPTTPPPSPGSADLPRADEERAPPESEEPPPARIATGHARSRRPPRPSPRTPLPPAEIKLPEGPPALTGQLAKVDDLIEQGQVEQALVDALRWRAEQPGDVMALVALGEAVVAQGRPLLAARVYGSIIDLFPSRADMRRFAGARLEALGEVALALAADDYGQAVKQRPDHQSGHRMLAFALVRLGQYDKALTALEAGIEQRYRISRVGTLRILREDIGLVAAVLVNKEPNRRDEIEKRLAKIGARIADRPSLRFVLTWETDANDVDFHIYDGQGNHASYRNRQLPTGGVLFGDVRNGYGPECFSIDGQAKAYPYRLQIHYYSRGPMGYGMGKLQVLQHDGKGNLLFDERPFVVMNDRAYVDLGLVKGEQ